MLHVFGRTVEWCWFNSFIQHYWIQHVEPVWPPSWTTLIQHFHSTSFNIQWIQHIERVWSPWWMVLIQHFHSTPFNTTESNILNTFVATLVNGIEVCNLTLLHVHVFKILERAGQMDTLHCCSHHRTKEESLNGFESKSWKSNQTSLNIIHRNAQLHLTCWIQSYWTVLHRTLNAFGWGIIH